MIRPLQLLPIAHQILLCGRVYLPLVDTPRVVAIREGGSRTALTNTRRHCWR